MCRATSELWVAVSGTGAAGALAFLRMHWDAIRDRRAWRDAVRKSQPPGDGEAASDPDDDESEETRTQE